jgi:hypothetical protein
MWVAFYGAYLVIRGLAIGAEPTAMADARGIIHVERALGIFREAQIQDALSPAGGLLSLYYMLGFGPLVAVVLIWLAAADRATYRWLRTALFVSVAIAAVIHVLLPVAPPRLVHGLGIADTVGLSGGHDTGSFAGVDFNPYAAMPSMHVGWSLLIGVAGVRAFRPAPLRAFFALHPVLMTVTVVATGNHYLLDAAAGAAVVGVALLLIRAVRRACGGQPTRTTGGSSYRPSSSASSGSYTRISGRNRPSGAGSQLARPAGVSGSSRCSRMVSDPSAPRCSPRVRSPIEYRLMGFRTRWKSRASYMVTDQNAAPGGSWAKRSS